MIDKRLPWPHVAPPPPHGTPEYAAYEAEGQEIARRSFIRGTGNDPAVQIDDNLAHGTSLTHAEWGE